MQLNSILQSVACSNRQTAKSLFGNSNQDFLSAIRQQILEAPVNHNDVSTESDTQHTPSISNSIQVPTSPKVSQSAIIDGEEWNDKRLAGCIDVRGTIAGVPGSISMEKTINWKATGTDVLTPSQIADLQERYDIENMSKQDFYDLLSDLTHLNVVSAQDCTHLFWVHRPEMHMPGELNYQYNQQHLELNFVTHEKTNLLRLMQLEFEHALETLQWTGSRDFDERNPSMPPLVKQRYVDALSAETASYQKFFSIFQSIRR